MDTLGLTLYFISPLTEIEIAKLEKNRFIKVRYRGKEPTSIIVKISYPKFKGLNNATLVNDNKTILECNVAFTNAVRSIRPNELIIFKINRIDIPYTILMPEGKSFNEYKNIFFIFSWIYKNKHPKVNPKAINNFLEGKIETLILADAKNSNDYNHKITIYNQYKRMEETHPDDLGKTLIEHPDLKRRIRIEVSKKINYAPTRLEYFTLVASYNNFNNLFLTYIFENIFDFESYKNHYTERANKWTKLFSIRNKSYDPIISKNFKTGDYYEPIREGLRCNIKNPNTLDTAITKVRNILKEIEHRKGIDILKVKTEFERIYFDLKKYWI